MTVLRVLHVFCDREGQFGSPLGVVLDGPAIPPQRRRPLAAELGFSETVYVDDPDTGQLRIFTPAAELPFAGTPTRRHRLAPQPPPQRPGDAAESTCRTRAHLDQR